MSATLAGRTIVVTGCAAGIGRATAGLLSARGARVIGIDRNPAGHDEWLAQFVAADLGDPEAIDHAVGLLPDRVDGLCNIAGVPGTAGADVVRDVNYLGLRYLTQRLLARMMPGASVASAASVAGSQWRERRTRHVELAAQESFSAAQAWCREHPVDEAGSYPYFKEALVVWSMLAAAQQAGREVRINTVSPGPVDTSILDDFRVSLGTERVQADIDRVGRPGTADEIAPVFAFLMSADSSWITGIDLACDGGLAGMLNLG